LLKIISQKSRVHPPDPTQDFNFMTETRISCTRCGKVKYNTQEESVLGCRVPAIMKESNTNTTTTTGAATKEININDSSKISSKGDDSPTLYQEVSLDDVLTETFQEDTVDMRCGGCGQNVPVLKFVNTIFIYFFLFSSSIF